MKKKLLPGNGTACHGGKHPFSFCIIAAFLTAAALAAAVCCSACGGSGKKSVVMSLGKEKINSGVYTYLCCSLRHSLLSTYAVGISEETFWDSVVGEDGLTAEQYGDDLVRETAGYYLASAALFDELGLKLSDDDLEALEDSLPESGNSTDEDLLSVYGFDRDDLRGDYLLEYKHDALYDYLYGENGKEAITDAQLYAYLKKNYSLMKMIVIYTTEKLADDGNGGAVYDADGTIVTVPLTAEEAAQKREKIAEAEARLAAGEDFDEVMTAYSEVDSSYYSDGFFVSGADYTNFGEKYVLEAAGMKEGETRTVEDEGVVYITRKYPMPPLGDLTDADREQLDDLDFYCTETVFRERLAPYVEKIKADEDALSGFSIRKSVTCSLY